VVPLEQDVLARTFEVGARLIVLGHYTPMDMSDLAGDRYAWCPFAWVHEAFSGSLPCKLVYTFKPYSPRNGT
jgi:hypothetical protein